MTEADYDDTEVWPDNAETLNVYCAMNTQWRAGAGGLIGLDYAALPTVMKFVGVKRDRWTDVFEGVRLMEATHLKLLRR